MHTLNAAYVPSIDQSGIAAQVFASASQTLDQDFVDQDLAVSIPGGDIGSGGVPQTVPGYFAGSS